jgi:hypothetical protein
VLQLNVNVCVIGIDLKLQRQRLSLRANDFISKSVTLRTLADFLEIDIPGPWSSFLVASYNEFKKSKKTRTKNAPGAWGALYLHGIVLK